jgi:hydroxyacylglutathione hydrolase
MRIESLCLGSLATNCYLVETDAARVLIDPAEANDTLFAFLDNRKVDLVVNTHGHFDHVGGDWALKEQGAVLCLHRLDLDFVDRFFPGHPAFDRYLAEGDRVAEVLRVLHTPGHSPGSVVLASDGVLFCGDLLFAGSIGRTDLPGGSERAMAQSLARIADLEGEYTVYPGHGPQTTLDHERRTNPFLRRRSP